MESLIWTGSFLSSWISSVQTRNWLQSISTCKTDVNPGFFLGSLSFWIFLKRFANMKSIWREFHSHRFFLQSSVNSFPSCEEIIDEHTIDFIQIDEFGFSIFLFGITNHLVDVFLIQGTRENEEIGGKEKRNTDTDRIGRKIHTMNEQSKW